MNTGDPYDLKRFLYAQHETYAGVLKELQAGRKETHWIWYIFPQIKGLGSSPMAQKYSTFHGRVAKIFSLGVRSPDNREAWILESLRR
ncbi:MAG TPA: DUF1810 family protein [Steroidobacteraceae bacterium]